MQPDSPAPRAKADVATEARARRRFWRSFGRHGATVTLCERPPGRTALAALVGSGRW